MDLLCRLAHRGRVPVTGVSIPPGRFSLHRSLRRPFAAAAAALLVAAGLRAQEAAPAAPPAASFGDELDVTLVTTSFYVIDADGRPVRDLRSDEVEVRVGGEPMPLAHFEAVAGIPASAETPAAPLATPAGTAAPAPVSTAPPRHVFLFFDLAFSLPRGVEAARKIASEMVDDFGPNDLLYLVTYKSHGGLEQELGPAQSAPQRRALRERIAGIELDQVRLRGRRPDLQPIAQGKVYSGHVEDGYREAQATELVNYELQGADLAKQLETFANFLRQVPGPKVILYFSQGIDSDVYGGAAAGVASRKWSPDWDVSRHTGLHVRFEPALKALAETGAMLFYVNPIVGFEPDDRVTGVAVDAEAHWVNDAPTGDGSLQLMSEVSGGMVLRDPNPETLLARIDSWLDGRYELGVYLAAAPGGGPLAADIRVTRPGVRAWTTKWLQPPRSLHELAPSERAFLAVQLVLQSDPAPALRNLVVEPLQPLRGIPGSAREGEKLRLRFEPAVWTDEQLLRGLELFSVVVAPGDPPQLSRLEQRLFTPTPAREPVESVVPAAPELLWGLVAFDLTSGRIYLGRFPIAPELAAPSPTPAGAGR